MQIPIGHIKQWQERRSQWNNTPLEDIEFTLNGEIIDPDVTEQVMKNINEIANRLSLLIAQWSESEISKSAKVHNLDHLPLLEQAAQLQEMGYQYRIYPECSHHWGRFSPVFHEWFDISVFKVEVKP